MVIVSIFGAPIHAEAMAAEIGAVVGAPVELRWFPSENGVSSGKPDPANAETAFLVGSISSTDTVVRRLLRSDLLVVLPDGHPSDQTLLLALACSIPVLAPRSNGGRSVLGGGATSYELTGRPGEIAASAGRLLQDRAGREAAIRRGKAVVRRAMHRDQGLSQLIVSASLPLQWPVHARPPSSASYNRLSVVIACYGKLPLTEQCVASLLADVPDAEVIIVDNGSSDGTASWAKEKGHTLLRFTENRGVPIAWNAGLGIATGDLLCVLNNDTVIHPGGMRELSRGAWSIGISAHQGGMLSQQLVCLGLTTEAEQSDYPDGCALVFRRDVWERVGPFDEGMRIGYCEDSDWGMRARSLGYGWGLVPDALTHLGHETACEIEGIQEHHHWNRERLRARWEGKGAGERLKVRRWGMLGDVLMLTPALSALRRERPLARIHLQCAPEIADLLTEMPYVDAVGPSEYRDYTTEIDLDYATWDPEQRKDWPHPTFAFASLLGVPITPEPYWVPRVEELASWAQSLLPRASSKPTRYIACGLRSEKREKANWGESRWLQLVQGAQISPLCYSIACPVRRLNRGTMFTTVQDSTTYRMSWISRDTRRRCDTCLH